MGLLADEGEKPAFATLLHDTHAGGTDLSNSPAHLCCSLNDDKAVMINPLKPGLSAQVTA